EAPGLRVDIRHGMSSAQGCLRGKEVQGAGATRAEVPLQPRATAITPKGAPPGRCATDSPPSCGSVDHQGAAPVAASSSFSSSRDASAAKWEPLPVTLTPTPPNSGAARCPPIRSSASRARARIKGGTRDSPVRQSHNPGSPPVQSHRKESCPSVGGGGHGGSLARMSKELPPSFLFPGQDSTRKDGCADSRVVGNGSRRPAALTAPTPPVLVLPAASAVWGPGTDLSQGEGKDNEEEGR
ncbi:unnamed protein product, partial [Discosporangium mesarthrocarpum]